MLVNKNEQNEEVISETFDFSKPDFEFKPKENHTWVQQGPYLLCKSCEIEHATYIGMGKLMVGIKEDGTPIFKKR